MIENATLSIGSKIGYSDGFFTLNDLKNFLKSNFNYSVEITETTIVLNNMDEKHYKLSILNYPKKGNKKFKKSVKKLTKRLMLKFNQNRIILFINNKSYIFENSKKMDPNI